MTFSGLLIFLAAYAAAAALPGPGIASLVARVLARGIAGVPAYILGFVVGDLVWFAVAVTGLAAIAAAYSPLITAIRLAGASYLFIVAMKLIAARPQPPGETQTVEAKTTIGELVAGLTLTLGNPKVIVFFVALLPLVIDVRKLDFLVSLLLASFMALTLCVILAAYALLAASARRIFNNKLTTRALNVGTGLTMAGVAVAIAIR